MRTAFFEALTAIAAADKRVVLITADLGYLAIECFADRCPAQFVNAGVCEQNMAGMAVGLAEAGFVPFLYSIAPFAVLRPYEFIRNGAIAHRLPVRIVSVADGLDYGTNGISHFGIDDIGALRVQPSIALIAPVDDMQAQSALRATWDMAGPAYFRLSKTVRPAGPVKGRFALGETQTVRDGADVLVVALGTMVHDALAAADLLAAQGVNAAVELVDNLNALPLNGLRERLGQFNTVLAVESHYVNGGLGSMVCEMVAEAGLGCRVVRCGVPSVPDGVTGSREFLHERYGLAPRQIAARALSALGR